MKRFGLATALMIGLLLVLEPAWAQQLPGFVSTPGRNGSTVYSLPVQTLLFMTFLTVLPGLLLMMTGFTRIVIVMSLLRMALGTQNSPPNQVIIGLSLFLTFYIMSPTFNQVYNQAYLPYDDGKITFQQAVDVATKPVAAFMIKQTRAEDFSLFASYAEKPVSKVEDAPMSVLIPAFVTSELKTAFQIGFMIFLPFLIIDLIVSSVLMSMGMMMLSPMLISLPFKLMLFVLIDGWNLLMGSLIQSFA
ncbi:flagellar type III secretion system pore protein FliP [Limnobacter humi]|uniref:Flagellar biosynthetic protein FliP n=1 Tax=Limnobacter humi TaxID=1778671 RepID=A0ABT1WJ20_9BURK|nr:flagellar type III secretion system pore protein FliP [Limnobacter humi]MCQ8897507.1 flagellar type III secretion system pore protein FliP [Limnobacter humi]